MSGEKMLSLIKVIVLGVATVIVDGAGAVPWWFVLTVQITWDAGRTMQDKSLDVGIFYMDQGKLNMIDLIFVEKASNARTLPDMLRVAQIFYGLGGVALFVCFVASLIYHCRKYRSMTGEMCLAAGLLPASICLVLGVVFAALSAVIDTGRVWEELPVPNSYQIVAANPAIAINYGLYAAAVGALVALVGTGLAWMQACSLCKHVEAARYQLLHAPLTEDERGLPSGQIYRFPTKGAPSSGFKYDGGYGQTGPEMDF